MSKSYWDMGYWERHLAEKHRMDIFDNLWIRKHQQLIDTLEKGTVLDLGCGIGQYTDYWFTNGFDVISTDISVVALEELKKRTPNAKTLQLDMGENLPFGDATFEIVFANLSIHYFDRVTTQKLASEINRILKPNGFFIGSVNSSKAYEFLKDRAQILDENYYLIGDRYIRLFDRQSFDLFFHDFRMVSLEETHITRFQGDKDMWEFIYQKS